MKLEKLTMYEIGPTEIFDVVSMFCHVDLYGTCTWKSNVVVICN